ncbi:MAG: hypothetical protein JEY99_12805 [Spirochaetales bacterium]|nr:hypothetical protein [Spirochaetales bacterium]
MEKTILFAGTGSLCTALVDEYLSRGNKVVSAVFDNQKQEPGKNLENSRQLRLPWAPGSSLSPRNIIMKGESEMGQYSEAFLIFPSGRTGESFHEISSAAIQKIIDYRVKSYLFFYKELLNYFIRKKEGEINAILYSEEGEWQSPLNAGTFEMFKAVIHSSFAIYEREPFSITGFESGSRDLEGYKEFILNQKEKESRTKNKFHKFSDKGLFTFSSQTKKKR